MEISLKPIGKTILQLRIEANNFTIIEDVTNLNGIVDENLISDLRNIANEMEEHNLKTKQDEHRSKLRNS